MESGWNCGTIQNFVSLSQFSHWRRPERIWELRLLEDFGRLTRKATTPAGSHPPSDCAATKLNQSCTKWHKMESILHKMTQNGINPAQNSTKLNQSCTKWHKMESILQILQNGINPAQNGTKWNQSCRYFNFTSLALCGLKQWNHWAPKRGDWIKSSKICGTTVLTNSHPNKPHWPILG